MRCKNCNGRGSNELHHAPCEICKGTGITQPPKPDPVFAIRVFALVNAHALGEVLRGFGTVTWAASPGSQYPLFVVTVKPGKADHGVLFKAIRQAVRDYAGAATPMTIYNWRHVRVLTDTAVVGPHTAESAYGAIQFPSLQAASEYAELLTKHAYGFE